MFSKYLRHKHEAVLQEKTSDSMTKMSSMKVATEVLLEPQKDKLCIVDQGDAVDFGGKDIEKENEAKEGLDIHNEETKC